VQHWTSDGLSPGDVLVSNHPQLAGGSHLPDITVITPVFVDGHKHPQFFVASRYVLNDVIHAQQTCNLMLHAGSIHTQRYNVTLLSNFNYATEHYGTMCRLLALNCTSN
jgi:Hydantoinase B/oxoprolinase